MATTRYVASRIIGSANVAFDFRSSPPPVVLLDITAEGWDEALPQASSFSEFMRQRQRREEFVWVAPTAERGSVRGNCERLRAHAARRPRITLTELCGMTEHSLPGAPRRPGVGHAGPVRADFSAMPDAHGEPCPHGGLPALDPACASRIGRSAHRHRSARTADPVVSARRRRRRLHEEGSSGCSLGLPVHLSQNSRSTGELLSRSSNSQVILRIVVAGHHNRRHRAEASRHVRL
jgi:hypothetical protein